jgi:hypothetical protein
LSDPTRIQRQMKKDIKRTPPRSGDPSHAGSGDYSTQVGPTAQAQGYGSVAIGFGPIAFGGDGVAIGTSAVANHGSTVGLGDRAKAWQPDGMALGSHAYSDYARSSAIGYNAETTAADQIMLGNAGTTVVIPGAFTPPSARRLKRCIKDAPVMRDVFPRLVEFEYKTAKGRKRIGHIADELVGTGAERFVSFDDEGRVAGIETVALHAAQIYALLELVNELRAEVSALKNEQN